MSTGFLREAARTLRDVAPQINGPLQGLADPVAEWLEYHAAMRDALGDVVQSLPVGLGHPAYVVASAVLGRKP